MATRHGAKIYVQLLLDPNRAELLLQMAKEQSTEEVTKRPTDLMRDILYSHLERVLPSSVYGEAAAKDHAVWKESVRNRVKGRSKKKKDLEDG
jgi:hypothetical protein